MLYHTTQPFVVNTKYIIVYRICTVKNFYKQTEPFLSHSYFNANINHDEDENETVNFASGKREQANIA